MAEQFLEEIYQHANTVSKLRQIVELIRKQDDHNAILQLNATISGICSLCEQCVESQYIDGMSLWKQVQQLNEIQGDLILVGDVIENGILPIMESWIQTIAHISQIDEDEYLFESTSSGFLTLKNIETNMYIHSNNNPMEEARILVEHFYDPKMNYYSVYGCGLGYHIYQLYLISKGSVPIKVFDINSKMVEYARLYGVLEWIPKDVLEIRTDDSVLSFLESLDNSETGMFFHIPSVRQIKNEIEREAILGICVQQNTLYKFKIDSQINFWRNIKTKISSIDKLDSSKIKKEMVIVAAGPSLDDNMENLRLWKNKKTIVAVGTVFRKLVNAGISPDYVVIMDPQKRTLKQLEGVENEQIPMILDMTAYWEFARVYRGPKYMVCIPGGREEIRQYAKQNNLTMWTSGGTVTSMALEFAIHYKAEKIYFVGVDLAYPEGVSHASGTMDCSIKNTEKLPKVQGVRGQEVYADRVFISYRKWIEERIEGISNITFYNMSRRGAHIEGTIEM